MGNFEVANPATKEVLATLTESGPAEVQDAVQAVRAGQADWSALDAETRAGYLMDLAKVLQARGAELVVGISQVGKPMAEARFEVDECVSQALLLAREGPAWLDDEETVLDGRRALLHAEPRGVAAVLTPSNFPLWQPLRWLMPALLAGNTCVLKPSPHGTLTALALRRAFEEAQLPRGVLRLVLGGSVPGEALVRASVDIVAFAGSHAAGKAVAQACAECFQPSILELDGIDPFLMGGSGEELAREGLRAFCAMKTILL